jgi:hypothetical protein
MLDKAFHTSGTPAPIALAPGGRVERETGLHSSGTSFAKTRGRTP